MGLHATALQYLKEGGRQLQVGYISHYPKAAGHDANPDKGNELGDAFWGGKTWKLPGDRTVYFNVWEGMRRAPLSGAPGGTPLERLFGLWGTGEIKALVDAKVYAGLEQAPDAV